MCALFSFTILEIREVHSGGLGGHFGVSKTMQPLKALATMPQETNQFSCQCYTCQTVKGLRTNARIYTLSPILLWPWTYT